MKKTSVLALAAALTLGATSALAWSGVTGRISSLDSKAHTIVLDNGKTYSIERKVAISRFKPGDTVTLSVQERNGQNLVNRVTKAG